MRNAQFKKKRNDYYLPKGKLKKQIDNLVTLLMDDPELRDIYSKKLKEHKQQLNALDERIQLFESQLKNISKEPIDAEALKHLLQNLDTILEHADATEKKELLALFIKDIHITREKISSKEGRQIKTINLMFDFTIEALQGGTGVLLNQMSAMNCVAPLDLSFMNESNNKEKTIREALASLNLLPLFMVRFTVTNLNEVYKVKNPPNHSPREHLNTLHI
ncbi:hypothetical protein ACQ5SI_10220 [Peribacillus frigoritolerans]|uniref:hypothetical protein n=1 Tax=Peribacillus frigoritolerans TaxID=450367 RepID=UPI003D330CF7